MVGMSGHATVNATTSKLDQILVCDGIWDQSSMRGHVSERRRVILYPNPDATKIRLETFGQVEGICFTQENATCDVTFKGKTLIVTSTFPKLVGTQTFTFDPDTAHMSFGTGGLDGGQMFSGTCHPKN
jgi:hypothetical protein